MTSVTAAAIDAELTTPTPFTEAPLSALESELKRLSAEVLSIHCEFQTQMTEALQREHELIGQGYLERLQQAERFRAEVTRRANRLSAEIERVSDLLDTIERNVAESIDDPGVDLSWVMKRKGEERVLRSYLEGLRFAEL